MSLVYVSKLILIICPMRVYKKIEAEEGAQPWGKLLNELYWMSSHERDSFHEINYFVYVYDMVWFGME